MFEKLCSAIYSWLDEYQTNRFVKRLKKLQAEEERNLPTFRGSIYQAISKLAPYSVWYIQSTKHPDYYLVLDTVTRILRRAHSLSGRARLLNIDYGGLKNAGMNVWIWQIRKTLASACAYPTPKLLILVDINHVKITYFYGRMMSENEWWKQKEIENANWNDIEEAIRWIDTYQCEYQKQNNM